MERDNLYSAFYKLTDSSRQITSFVYDCSASRLHAFICILARCGFLVLRTFCSETPSPVQHDMTVYLRTLIHRRRFKLLVSHLSVLSCAVRATVPKINLDDVFTVG